jgi:thioredoxin-like negative regulator of GroEL
MRFRSKKHEKELAAAIEQGWQLIRQGKDQEALELLEKAAHRFPRSADIRLMLATVYLDLRPEDEAAQLAKAAELGVDDPSIQIRAGHRLWNIDDLEGARRCAARASELADAEDKFILAADLESLIGHLAASDGEYAFAEEKLRSALQREPEYPTHPLSLARFLWARGRDEDALTVIDESLPQIREDLDTDLLKQLRSEIVAG